MNDYCHRYVEKMGEDAEGPFVELGLLFIALQCFGVTVFFDRRDEIPLSFLETNPSDYLHIHDSVDVCVLGSLHVLVGLHFSKFF